MEPKKSIYPKNPGEYRPLNGSKINGALHSLDANGIDVANDKALKSQIMMRLQELEKQNDGLKSIIEQRKNEIATLIATNKKYISVLAHDLKSPFSTIYGVLQILRDCIHENNYEEMETFIDIASSSSLNTTNLIENILVWANSQSNEKRLNPIRVNLACLVEREIENSTLAVKLKKISLSHSIPKTIMLRADLQMTQSIIRNLISNAIKFTHPYGKIVISAKEVIPFIEVSVTDDGKGISPEQQQEILGAEHSEVLSDNNNIKGKGLGLRLCKDFVEVHGGTLRLESQLNHGSSFFFTLPKDEQ